MSMKAHKRYNSVVGYEFRTKGKQMNSATSVGVELHELVSVAAAIVGILWMLGKIGLAQFMARIEDKFNTVDLKLKTFDPLHGELARVDKDLIQVRLEMSTTYVRQEGIRTLTTRMEQLFKEVFDKLDSKADKSECGNHHTGRCQ
jgi:hypothetical protein